MAETLYNILLHTYHPDKALRTQAEQALEQYVNTDLSALAGLLAMVKNREISPDLRKAAAIQVKNKIKPFWDPKDNTFSFPDSHKNVVKSEIVLTILDENDNSIRRLLAESFRKMVEYDYPEKWPGLLPAILSMAQTDNVMRMHNALVLLRQIAKRYAFKPADMRQPLNDLIEASFPSLQGLMTQIISNNSLEAAQVMKVCLKIFWSATHYILPIQVKGVDVNLWFQMIASILQKDLPEASTGLEPLGQPVDKEDRRNWPWWKLKKWAIRITSLFIQRYGNPRYCNDEYVQFAEFFKANTSKQLLSPVLHILQQRNLNGVFCTDEVHRMCLVYVNSCFEMAPTYKIIKPNLDWLLFKVLFGAFEFTEEEMEIFNDDPSEFIRKVADPLEDWIDHRLAAINVLQMAARYREKDVLPKVMAYIQQLLVQYSSDPLNPSNYHGKEAALVAMAALSGVLSENKTYKSQIEPFFVAHVIPEFNSVIPFIRFRAFWLLEFYNDQKWKNKQMFVTILKGCLQGLRDPSIPVQAAAATSMRQMLERPAAHEIIRPILHEVVGEYFRLMEEVDSSAILTVIQTIVQQFGDDLHGIAPAMVTKIVEQFREFSAEAGEDNDEAAFSATECLETVGAIMTAVCDDHPEVLLQLEVPIVPLLYEILTSETQAFEYIENVASLLGFLTYYPEVISQQVYSLAGPLMSCLEVWAFDYMLELATPILNYISKDINMFLSSSYLGVNHLDRLLPLCEKAIVHDNLIGGREAKAASVMLTCLLTTCENQELPQPVVAKILEIILTRIGQDELENHSCEKRVTKDQSTSFRTKLLEAAMACIIYSPEFALQLLKANEPACKLFFNMLFLNLPNMSDLGSQKLIVMCFSCIMSCMPASNLPPVLQGNLLAMLQQMVREIKLIKEEEAKEDEYEDEDDEMGDEDDDEDDDADMDTIKKLGKLDVPDGGFDEDEDCVNVEDESYRDYLNSLTSMGDKAKHMIYQNGELMDGYEDDEDEALEYTGGFENVNIVKYFIKAMQTADAKDNTTMSALRTQLTPEDQQQLQAYIVEASMPDQEPSK